MLRTALDSSIGESTAKRPKAAKELIRYIDICFAELALAGKFLCLADWVVPQCTKAAVRDQAGDGLRYFGRLFRSNVENCCNIIRSAI